MNIDVTEDMNEDMPLDQMEANAQEASALLKAMSNETRLMILCQLLHGEKSAGELDTLTSLSQSALSQHLAVLRENGLVQTRRESQSIFYSIEGEKPRAIIDALYRLFNSGETRCA